MAKKEFLPTSREAQVIHFPEIRRVQRKNFSTPDLRRIHRAQETRTIESLRGITDVSDFFDTVSKKAAVIAKRFIQQGTDKDKDKDKAYNVLDHKDFSGVPYTSEEYNKLLGVAFIKSGIERQLVRAAIKEKKDSLDITDAERVVLTHSMDLGDQFDRFYWQWRKNVVTSDLGKTLARLSSQDPEVARTYLVEHGAQIPEGKYLSMTLNQSPEGNIETVPYVLAFAEPIEAINEIMENLVEDLENVGVKNGSSVEEADRMAYIQYFKGFKKALVNSDPQQQEELSRDLDRAWMNLKGSLLPIHPIETYLDPLGIRIDPNYGIAAKDSSQQSLNERVENSIVTEISYLKRRYERDYGDNSAFHSSISAMQNSDAGIFTILGAGNRIDTGFAAQIGSNRMGVRYEHGSKIIFNLEEMKSLKGVYEGVLTKVFGEEYVNSNFADVDSMITYLVSVHVPSHEVSHSFLITEETERVFDPVLFHQLDEHRSDAAGISSAQEHPDRIDPLLTVKTLLAYSLHQMKRRDDIKARPYYNIALSYLKTMYDAGIISLDNTSIHFSSDSEKNAHFFQKTEEALDGIVAVFDTLDLERARAFFSKSYEIENPDFNFRNLIDAIHTKLDLPSPGAVLFPGE